MTWEEVVTFPGIVRPADALLAGEVVERDLRHRENEFVFHSNI